MDVVINDNLEPNEMRKNILKLSWPAILRLFLQSLVGFVDMAMIGVFAKQKDISSAIGAVGVSNKLIFIILGSFTALSIGSTALVAHHIGAKNEKKANEILWQSILISVVMALVFAIIGLFFSEHLLKFMLVLMEDPDPFIISEGSIYMKIVLISMIFGFPLMIINAVFQGIGDMKTPLFLMIITNLTNVLFNYLLIFGKGFFPELGVVGAGLGSAIGRSAGCMVGLLILINGKSHLKLAFKYLKLKLEYVIIKSIFKIGIPSSLEQFARQSSQIVITIFVAGLAAASDAISANEIAMIINMLAIMPGFGFGIAALTLVGQSLGADKKELAEQYAKQSTLIGTILMIPVSILLFIFARPLVLIFSDKPEVIPMAVTAVRIIIVTQPILTLVLVLSGGLRGAGDTLWVMIITVIGNWGFRVVLGILLGYYFKLGLTGFWIAIAIDIGVRAILMMLRFKSGRWKHIKVLTRKEKLQEVLD